MVRRARFDSGTGTNPTTARTGLFTTETGVVDYVVGKESDGTIFANPHSPDLERKTGSEFHTVVQSVVDDLTVDGVQGTAGHIRVKKGVYTSNGKIQLKEGVSISGTNKPHNFGQTKIVLGDGVNDDMFECFGYNIVSNLFLSGNKANNSSGHGIFQNQDDSNSIPAGRCSYYELLADSFPEDGFHLENGFETVLYSILAKENDGNGFWFNNGDSGAGGFLCTLLRAVDNGNWGAEVRAPAFITASRFRGNSGGGVAAGNNSVLASCDIKNNGGANRNAQIWTSGFTETVITNNHIDCGGSTDFGIKIQSNTSDSIINSNAIYRANVEKISADSLDGNIINGLGYETANAEEPQQDWQTGQLIEFTDSGDGSGSGTYLAQDGGTFTQLA